MQQSGERVKLLVVQNRKQWSDRVAIFAATVVVLVWLFASWSALGAELVLSASAGALTNYRATETVFYTSSAYGDSRIRLYLHGKRWGSSDLAVGSWQIPDLPVGSYKFTANVGGASPQWSNEVVLRIGSTRIPSDPKRVDAARLLLRAGVGPRSVVDIDEVASRTATAWIDAEFVQPWNSHAGYLAALRSQSIKVEEQHICEAIWQNMMFSDARLRWLR